MDLLANGSVAQAFRRWRRQGYDLDYRNANHVSAFVLAKQSNARAKAEEVLAILRTQETQHKTTVSVTSEFWVLLKDKAPNPLPPQVLENIVPMAELLNKYSVPEDIDLRSVHVIDMACDRCLLGSRVRKVTFSEAISRSMVGGCEASMSLKDGVRAPGTPESVASPSSNTTASTHERPALAATEGDARRCSALVSAPTAWADATADARAEDQPEPKRLKVLKMMGSDPSPPGEREAADWQKLLQKINTAAKAGSFYSDDKGNCCTVHFWATQVGGRS